jgi:predicted DNA binding CopG/RHH family protein
MARLSASSRRGRPRGLKQRSTGEGTHMRKEYNFPKSRKNPYAGKLKKQITLRLDEEAIDYFKAISKEGGIPYQSLINLYIKE